MRGPVAPKDPTKKRPKIYFILEDSIVTAHPTEGGNYREIIYLENRVQSKIALVCPAVPAELAAKLQDSEQFRAIVHSIGVTVEAENPEEKETPVTVELEHYGKTSKYGSGSVQKMEIAADGAERVFTIEELEKGDDDANLGTLFLTSPKQGLAGRFTMTFYLNDGYSVPEPEVDPAIDWESENYRAMLDRSLLSLGDPARIQRVIEKAQSGESVTLAFIGGSITQGAGAKPIESRSYAYRVKEAFAKKYAKNPEQVTLVKAGIGGTSSEFGLVRYDLHVLRNGAVQPDLVVIEYAVNDEGDETKGICYESLVSHAYHGESKPAVLLLFSVFMDDYNLEERLVPIGKNYQLPMVSIKSAVSEQFREKEGRVLTKRQYFYDCYHPSNDGHRIMADCIMRLLENAAAAPRADEQPWPETVVYGRAYENPILLHRDMKGEDFLLSEVSIDHGSFASVDSELQVAEWDEDATGSPIFPNNWMRPVGCQDLAPFFMTLKCRYLFIIIKDTGSSDYGEADIYVNGRLARTINPREVGWTHCNSLLVIPDGEAKEYNVKISPKNGTENGFFTILGFSYGR